MDDNTVDAEWHSLVVAWFSRGRWSIRFTRHTPLGFSTLLAPFSECLVPSTSEDSEMSKSPHAAHLQMREDRRFAQLQRAWEKDQLLEMQRKLERWGLGVVELQSLFQTEYGKKKASRNVAILNNGP